jgi:hypothetical protein
VTFRVIRITIEDNVFDPGTHERKRCLPKVMENIPDIPIIPSLKQ